MDKNLFHSLSTSNEKLSILSHALSDQNLGTRSRAEGMHKGHLTV